MFIHDQSYLIVFIMNIPTTSLVNVNTNSNNFNIFNIFQITAFGLDGTGSFKANSDDGFFFLFFLCIQQNTDIISTVEIIVRT